MKSQERIELISDSFYQYYYGHLSVTFSQWGDLRDLIVLQDDISDDNHKTLVKIIGLILEAINEKLRDIQ